MSQDNTHTDHQPTKPKREHPSTYFVQDRSNMTEMERIHFQDQLLTTNMSGVLAEQPDPARFESVLDVGCGTGGWLIELAKTYPHIKRLVGVDINSRIIDYARDQAIAEKVSDRVEFATMDALRLLEFRDRTFHLVNHRLGMGWLRKWDWPQLLREYQRVCKPHGIVRITEGDLPTGGDSAPAFKALTELTLQSFVQAGNFFEDGYNGMTSHLARLLHQYGLQNVQTRTYSPEYRFGTLAWQLFFEDMKRFYQTATPYLRKWTRVPDNYEELYQQMLSEMQQPDFVAVWPLLTAWGINSVRRVSKTPERD